MPKTLKAFDALIAGLRGRPNPNSDWHAVLALANQSLTVTTLAARIRDHGACVPEDVSQFLAAIVARNRSRNERLRQQFAEVADALSLSQIEMVPIKGAAFLVTATDRTMADRILSDLDMYVAPQDFERAKCVLIAAGYQLLPGGNPLKLVAVLGRSDHAATIDLHGSIAGLSHFNPMAGARQIMIDNGVRIALPTSSVQTAILMAHDILRGKDYLWGLFDLRHLADIDDLARSDDPPDWAVMTATLPRWMTTALRSQMLALCQLFETNVTMDQTRPWRAWLNFHRRRLQIAYPRLMPALVLVSVAADPYFLGARRSALMGKRPPTLIKNRSSQLGGIARIGKV
jgi:hypothetical protein